MEVLENDMIFRPHVDLLVAVEAYPSSSNPEYFSLACKALHRILSPSTR